MSTLSVGTPCFLVGLIEMAELNGRVVEVATGPMFLPDDVADWYYSVTGSWAREQVPDGVLLLAPRKHLQPNVPPDFAPTSLERITNDA